MSERCVMTRSTEIDIHSGKTRGASTVFIQLFIIIRDRQIVPIGRYLSFFDLKLFAENRKKRIVRKLLKTVRKETLLTERMVGNPYVDPTERTGHYSWRETPHSSHYSSDSDHRDNGKPTSVPGFHSSIDSHRK
jgi:hypothetical protein